MKHLKHVFLLALMLVCNFVIAMAQPNAPANHNIGCSADKDQTGGAALSNVNNLNVVLAAGDRTSNVSGLQQQDWGSSNISTTSDNEGHTIYKFNTPWDNASGGFYFNDLSVTSDNYVHVAIFAESGDQSVKVRLATSGGQAGTYNQYQVDSPFQPLNQGWNYLNLSLSSFAYDGNNGATNFKTSQVNQVGFVFSTANRNLYVDDIYFYNYNTPIVAANHSLGCTASTGAGSEAIAGANNIQTILSAGDRKATVTSLEQQIWDGASSKETTQDAEGHTLYKFTPANNYGNGGFYFEPHLNVSDDNTRLHAAIYAESQTKVQVRLATPGGNADGHYEQYQVNSPEIQLNPGWNYVDLPLDVHQKNRRTSGNYTDGFEYWFEADQTEAYNFKLSEVQQVGFVVTEANHSIYVDDMYFYEPLTSTVDNDGEGIDWNTTTGTTCQVKRVFQPTGEIDPEQQNPITNAYDASNGTYYGISKDEAAAHQDANNAFYFIAELRQPITVSDVELVWGNGYPANYAVYALKDAPSTGWTVDNLKSVDILNDNNKLFGKVNPLVSYEPYYNTESNLYDSGFQEGKTRYLVIKMWQPINETFGFKIDEIHVGAYDDEYNTPDHLSAPDLSLETEEYHSTELVPTVRNNRNAEIKDKKITSINYSVEDGNDRYVNIYTKDGKTMVWASSPGDYVIDVTGSVDGTEVKLGKVKVNVTRDWRGEHTNTKSIIQDLHDNNIKFLATNTQPNNSSENFNINNIGDNSLSTRWSSGEKGSAENQYITIPLSSDGSKNYQIRDLEFVWERAYPGTYAVYGFDADPNIKAESKQSYDDFMNDHGNRLLYQATLPEKRDYFPYRDLHLSGANANGTANTNVRNDLNDSKYLVVAFKSPTKQANGDSYGVSMWEMYAQANEVKDINGISVSDKRMYLNTQDAFSVKSTKDGEPVSEHLNDVTFSLADADGDKLATAVTESNGIYTVTSNGVKVAEIWDAGNNTYAVKSGTDKSLAGKQFNITANYRNGSNNISTTFALEIVKKPMDLLPTSTATNLVFDDGYYVEERLEKYASPQVLTVDLTNVDFSTSYDGITKLDKIKIISPRDVNWDDKTGGKKSKGTYTIGMNLDGSFMSETIEADKRQYMNPNAIYFVPQDAYQDGKVKAETERIHGENVALRANNLSSASPWYVDNLRIFDGYDFAPKSSTVNPTEMVAHNAFFYTNIPENKKSTLVMPFEIRMKEPKNKGIIFYKPEMLHLGDSNHSIDLKEVNDDKLDGNTVYVADSKSSTTVRSGGYGVTMVSTSYKLEGETVPVGMSGRTEELPIADSDNKAILEGTFVENKLSDGNDIHDFYLYSPTNEAFLPAGDEWFDFEKHPDHATSAFKGKNHQYRLLPFYAYLKVPCNRTTGAKAARISWIVDDNNTTGIKDIQADKTVSLDVNAPMYDITGRRVNSQYRGIVIQNGKKFIRK